MNIDRYVFDLPRPPSVNNFTPRLGNTSPAVVKWIRDADRIVLALAPKPYPRLKGAFEIGVTWPSSCYTRVDIDNPQKALLDYLERIEMIENDRFCCRITTEFGVAPEGCRVSLVARPDVELPQCQTKTKSSERAKPHGTGFVRPRPSRPG
jgi:Holliday junction resolvase RusA-like endonuclease